MSEFVVDNLKYTIISGTPTRTVSLSGFGTDPTSSTAITIPVMVQNSITSLTYTVASIGSFAFSNKGYLTSVTFAPGSQITTIGFAAFGYTSGLTGSIILPDLLTIVDQNAFYASQLTNITIPALVTTIGNSAFLQPGTRTIANVYFNNANALTNLGSTPFNLPSAGTVTFYNMASAADLNSTAQNLPQYFTTKVYSASPPCFHPDTRLLCYNETTGLEEWVKIMDLYKDKGKDKSKKVKTYLHGYRDIENIGKGYMINNPHHKIKCMYRSTELLEKELNVTELMVTGAHAILLDSTQYSTKSRHYKSVDKKWLVRACDVPAYFEKVTDVTPFDYYHLSLSPCLGSNQTIFGIYVNGDSTRVDNNRDDNMCIMETMDDAVFKKSQAFSNQSFSNQ